MNGKSLIALILGGVALACVWLLSIGEEPEPSAPFSPAAPEPMKQEPRADLGPLPVELETPPLREVVEDEPELQLVAAAEDQKTVVELGVTFKDGVLLVGGTPFSDLELGTWPLMELRQLTSLIRDHQALTRHEILNRVPGEDMFVPVGDYMAQRMWHEDTVFHSFVKKQRDGNGDMTDEIGVIRVTRDISQPAYTLREAVLEIYSQPVFIDHLMEAGNASVARTLEQYPDAVTDVSQDLTTWATYNSEGAIVGWYSMTKHGDN